MNFLRFALVGLLFGCASGSSGAGDAGIAGDAELDTSVADAGVDIALDVPTGMDAGCTSAMQCDDGIACSLNECVMGACVTTMPYDTTSDVEHCGDECMACPEPSEFQINMMRACRASECALECIDGTTDADSNTDNGCECAMGMGEDFPDVDGTDTDCDGIDGTVTVGVFVAPAPIGSIDGAGTREQPLSTISAGIAEAATRAGRQEVYIAEGTYDESLELREGVGLFGGYDAMTWQRMPGVLSEVRGSSIALRAEDIADPTTVQRMRIVSARATVAGGSSYAAFVLRSSGLTFEACQLEAGAGTDGVAGTIGSIGANGRRGTDGNAGCDGCGTRGEGGAGGSSICGSRGGTGGRGAFGDNRGLVGAAGLGPAPGSGGPGGAGDGSTCVFGCSDGQPGTAGGAAPRVGTAGAHASAPGASVIDQNGFDSGTGTSGSTGGHGSGGGGGGGGGGSECCRDDRGGGGGGGGSGGCGGAGGRGGTGGGNSVALFSFDASVNLIDCSLITAAAGDGGSGAAGGLGGAGGGGGSPGARADNGGPGGRGGLGSAGGRGGSGAGGNGGNSLCVVAGGGGTRPATFECSPGSPGLAGRGHSLAAGGNPGQAGRSL